MILMKYYNHFKINTPCVDSLDICIQFNYNAHWYINNGATNIHDRSKKGSGALVWQPAKLY